MIGSVGGQPVEAVSSNAVVCCSVKTFGLGDGFLLREFLSIRPEGTWSGFVADRFFLDIGPWELGEGPFFDLVFSVDVGWESGGDNRVWLGGSSTSDMSVRGQPVEAASSNAFVCSSVKTFSLRGSFLLREFLWIRPEGTWSGFIANRVFLNVGPWELGEGPFLDLIVLVDVGWEIGGDNGVWMGGSSTSDMPVSSESAWFDSSLISNGVGSSTLSDISTSSSSFM